MKQSFMISGLVDSVQHHFGLASDFHLRLEGEAQMKMPDQQLQVVGTGMAFVLELQACLRVECLQEIDAALRVVEAAAAAMGPANLLVLVVLACQEKHRLVGMVVGFQ
jgi:adenosine/AMP kinase